MRSSPDLKKINRFKTSKRRTWFPKLCVVLSGVLFIWSVLNGIGLLHGLLFSSGAGLTVFIIGRKLSLDYFIQTYALQNYIDDGYIIDELENRDILTEVTVHDFIEVAHEEDVLTRAEYIRKKEFETKLKQKKRHRRIVKPEDD